MKRLLFIFSIAFSSTGFSQEAKAIADKSRILIGEQIQLQLQGNFRKGQDQWKEIDTIPHFEVLERSDVERKENGNIVTLSQTLTLTSWDSGLLFIPPLQLGNATTAPVKIEVRYEPSPFDTSQPYHDVHDILDVKKPSEPTWYWYLIGLAILIILFLLFFPKGEARPRPDFVPDETAYKKALKRLAALQQKEMEHKMLYTEMIHIFREYLHKRKNIYSFSKTTGDLALQIDGLGMEKEGYHQLVQTLKLSDLVKYARFQPDANETENAIETIKQAIITIENLPHAV
jgi:hypothetical protein